MHTIPRTFTYNLLSKCYLETDGVRWTMFRMGPIHARDNGPGVSGAELECTARYRYLLFARIGIKYRRSYINRLRACAYFVGINRSRGARTPHEIPGGRQMIPKVCGHAWHDMTTINMKLFGTHQFSLNPVQVVLFIIYYVIINLRE